MASGRDLTLHWSFCDENTELIVLDFFFVFLVDLLWVFFWCFSQIFYEGARFSLNSLKKKMAFGLEMMMIMRLYLRPLEVLDYTYWLYIMTIRMGIAET